MRGHIRGMTLIDALIGVALLVIVFVGLAGVFRLALVQVTLNKMRAGAIALANERMEAIATMAYDDIGTVGGIPPGTLPPEETLTYNGVSYTRRTLVVYRDDPADGLGSEDHNGVTTDQKVAKVEVSWEYRGRTFRYAQSTIIAPPGIEAPVGGGTLRIAVVDAALAPVAGALVRVQNGVVDPPIDTFMFTNTEGEVVFGGAPAASDYQVTVDKDGYSTDFTLAPTPQIPTPVRPPLTVSEGLTTSATFAIDKLAKVAVRSFRAPTTTAMVDPLNDTSAMASLEHLQIGDGVLELIAGESEGVATSSAVAPSHLEQWLELTWHATSSPVVVQVWRLQGDTLTLVPDTQLPGNEAGFTEGPLDLRGIATTTAPALVVRFSFVRNGEGASPQLDWWRLKYRQGPAPLASVMVMATSSKILGYDAANQPVPKHVFAVQTGSEGAVLLEGVEWDSYTVGVPDWRIADVCPSNPVYIAPGATTSLDLFLAPDDGKGSVRAIVRNEHGENIPDATVRLTREAFQEERTTSACASAFFEGLDLGTYTIEASKEGFDPVTASVEVDGEETVVLTLLQTS